MPDFSSRMVDGICRASLLLFVCLAGYGVSGAAQDGQGTAVTPGQTQGTTDQPQGTTDQPQGIGRMRRPNTGIRMQKLEDKLSLNPEQKKKMQALKEEELGQMKTLRENRSLTREQKLEKFKQIREATHERIKGILTPEQRKKYEESLAKERTFRENLRQEKQENAQ